VSQPPPGDPTQPPAPAPAADDVELLLPADEIEREVLALGRRLHGELGDTDPLFLTLLGGSVIFLADLVRAYPAPVRFEFVHVGYHHPEVTAAEVLEIHYPIPVDLAGQHLLVVKDVVTSGVTETYLAEQLGDRGAASVRVVALIDMPEERKTDLAVDYRAFALERTGPLVGYGLKHDGRFGNLPYLGRYTGP
jgi:hypoxanthine phosphoribosyltransferase